jgi:hypothetical protein
LYNCACWLSSHSHRVVSVQVVHPKFGSGVDSRAGCGAKLLPKPGFTPQTAIAWHERIARPLPSLLLRFTYLLLGFALHCNCGAPFNRLVCSLSSSTSLSSALVAWWSAGPSSLAPVKVQREHRTTEVTFQGSHILTLIERLCTPPFTFDNDVGRVLLWQTETY